MAGIIPPLIRTQQPNQVPQIDRRGVAANLTAAFVSISGAPLVNAARPSQSLTKAGSPTFTFDSRLGQYIQLNGSSQYLRNTTFTQSGNTYPLTLSAWFYADALAAGNHTIIALTASGGTSVIFQLYTNGANLLSRQYNTSSQIVSATTLVTGKWYLATVVFESLSSRKLYLDGILQGTDTVTASAPSGINQIDIGASPWAGPGEYFQGRISAPMVLNAALTATQILALKSNPWQIFAPIQRQIFAAVAGGGGSVSLVISDSSHGHVADSPAFSMSTYLAVAESLHTHSAENLTLSATGAANLVVQDAAHAHIADSISLTTNWLLSIADALHSHAADNLSLDASNATFLTIQDALHSHAADSLGFSLDTWLTIVDAAHTHTADAPTLSASVALLIAEALHAHYADATVLSLPGETTLTPEDISAIASAVLAALNATTIPVDMQKTNGVEIVGDGSSGNKFRSVLYVG